MSEMSELLDGPLPTGTVEWIGIAQQRRGDIQQQTTVHVEPGTGITGEHHAQSGRSKRQVSLIQAEHLPVVAGFLKRDKIDPTLLRRNIVVSGVNLLALKGQPFRIGTAILLGAGPCAPCSRMNETLGEGGYAAMRGHGGIVATVLQAGEIGVGDAVVRIDHAAKPVE